MKTNTIASKYKGFRFPPEIISHAVWLYFRFSLSFRDVEELLAQRGIVVTYETVRQWCLKFGQMYANELRRRRPRCGDTWHLDEVFLKINGETHSLWRAVDQDGNVLDILVQCMTLSHRQWSEVPTSWASSCRVKQWSSQAGKRGSKFRG
jgi:putative transposase